MNSLDGMKEHIGLNGSKRKIEDAEFNLNENEATSGEDRDSEIDDTEITKGIALTAEEQSDDREQAINTVEGDDTKGEELNEGEETNDENSLDEVSEEDEDADDEVEEDGEDEEDEEEEEPRLKYSRITSLPPTVFTSDALSTCLISETFFAFATHGGVIHLTDTSLNLLRSYRAHRASILSLSTDGHYLASASMDGTVVVGSVTDAKDISAADFQRPVHSVAMDPNYKASRSYVSGGMAGKIIYSEKNWLGRRVDTILRESEETVIAVHWVGSLLIWVTDMGITIYSKTASSELLRIPPPESTSRPDIYNPRICVPESNRIYIAWVDTIWMLKVEIERSKIAIIPSGASVRSLTVTQKVYIESTRQVPWLIGGISTFGQDTILMLSYLPPKPSSDERKRPSASPPELKIYDLESGEEAYDDVLSLKGFERLGVNDYHLGQHSSPGTPDRYFVVSAKDAVIAVKRDLNDRVTWLLDRNMYKEAWEMSGNVLHPTERKQIGVHWVESLQNESKWFEAAKAVEQILSGFEDYDVVREDWTKYATTFIDSGKVEEISKVLPSNLGLKLSKRIYDKVLAYYLVNHKYSEFLHFVGRWPVNLYSSSKLLGKIEDQLQTEESTALRQALIHIYLGTDDPLSAVQQLLLLHDEKVIDVISKYHLLPSLISQIPQIMTVNIAGNSLDMIPVEIIRIRTSEAIKLIVDARHQVLPQTVIERLMNGSNDEYKKPMDIIAFLYLEQLNQLDQFSSKEFGDLQVRLYAEFDRPKLKTFIQKNNNYNFGLAVEICEENGYIEELVYLLGKVGQNKRALNLIIEKLNDPKQAIEFAAAQNDVELWEDLVNYSMDKPKFVRMLLQQGGSSIDPIAIIRRIPAAMEIEGLKQVLMQLFNEKDIVLSISKGVLEVIQAEARAYSHQLRLLREQGSLIDLEQVLEQDDTLDPFQSLLQLPDGSMKTESELIGEASAKKYHDRLQEDLERSVIGSVKSKVYHLAYILAQLR